MAEVDGEIEGCDDGGGSERVVAHGGRVGAISDRLLGDEAIGVGECEVEFRDDGLEFESGFAKGLSCFAGDDFGELWGGFFDVRAALHEGFAAGFQGSAGPGRESFRRTTDACGEVMRVGFRKNE
jgi:hypothetical protein